MNKAFVINLDRREDRWREFLAATENITIPIRRISAVDALGLEAKSNHATNAVVACWLSHQRVAEEFLAHDGDHCLVLEDDVVLPKRSKETLAKLWESNLDDIDLLQVGFCVHNNRLADRSRYSVQLFLSFFARVLGQKTLFAHRIFEFFYGNKFIFLANINRGTVQNTFELGTHAYFMSRRMANQIRQFNNPVFLPADLAMMEIATSGNFNCYRLIENIAIQSDSPSSILNSKSLVLGKIQNREDKNDDV